jgi:hypothetical protein
LDGLSVSALFAKIFLLLREDGDGALLIFSWDVVIHMACVVTLGTSIRMELHLSSPTWSTSVFLTQETVTVDIAMVTLPPYYCFRGSPLLRRRGGDVLLWAIEALIGCNGQHLKRSWKEPSDGWLCQSMPSSVKPFMSAFMSAKAQNIWGVLSAGASLESVWCTFKLSQLPQKS